MIRWGVPGPNRWQSLTPKVDLWRTWDIRVDAKWIFCAQFPFCYWTCNRSKFVLDPIDPNQPRGTELAQLLWVFDEKLCDWGEKVMFNETKRRACGVARVTEVHIVKYNGFLNPMILGSRYRAVLSWGTVCSGYKYCRRVTKVAHKSGKCTQLDDDAGCILSHATNLLQKNGGLLYRGWKSLGVEVGVVSREGPSHLWKK